jgi:hypothetical protein
MTTGTTFPAGILLVVLGVSGGEYGFSSLPLAVVLVLCDLVFSSVRRSPPSIRLIDIWRFAFVYLFGSEVMLSLADVHQDFGAQVATRAEGFVVAAFGATLVGYAMGRALFPIRLPRRAARRSTGGPQQTALVTLSIVVFAYLLLAISPQQLLDIRSARESLYGAGFLIGVAGMVVQAALTTRAIMVTRRRGLYVFPLTVVALSFCVLYAVGTRFLLGFLLSGVLFFLGRLMEPLSRRRLAMFGCVLVVVLALAATMRFVRGIGIADTDAGSVASSLVRPEAVLDSEGMVRVIAWVHYKEVYAERGRLPELGFLLYWWVPRTLWPSKPTMDGYWLAHEIMADGDVGSGHSVAGGFALPILLDFGPRAGVAFCLLLGSLLFALERFTAEHRNPRDPASIFASFLPFGVFFGMRSPQTSLIVVECCFMAYAPFFLFERWAPGRRRMRARRPLWRNDPYRVGRSSMGEAVSVPVRSLPAWFSDPRRSA